MAGKIAATSLTIAIGGSGGVFAPSLFMGAMLGTAYGAGVHHLFPGATAPAGAYGLVAMGGVFAGAAKAPITAVLIVFELTGDYQIVLPLMVTVVLSTGVASLLSRDSIYTLKLRRRGIDILQGRQANLMDIITVTDAMQPVPSPVQTSDTISEIIDRLSAERLDALPVVDDTGTYRGAITSVEVEQAARANRLDTTALDLVHTTATLRGDQSLQSALGALIDHDRTGLPVTSGDGTGLIGWVTHRDVLSAYNTRIRQSAQQSATQPRSVLPATAPLKLPDETIDARLQGLRIIELELNARADPVGKAIGDIAWPASTLLLAIRRDGHAFSPQLATTLAQGDRLTLLVPAEQAETLVDQISRPSGR
jgi:CIC family chloride channel protein